MGTLWRFGTSDPRRWIPLDAFANRRPLRALASRGLAICLGATQRNRGDVRAPHVSPHTTVPRVAVLGAGAVGCYFGGMLARAGVPVTLIGRAAHVAPVNEHGLHIRSIHYDEFVSLTATTELEPLAAADLVMVTVKTVDTESAARLLASRIRPTTTLLSLQNGVDNADTISAVTGRPAFAAVVYVAAEMTAPGEVTHTGRGDLIIGQLRTNATAPELERIAALFQSAGVPCVVSQRIELDLWQKLVMNCAYNAISALAHARYGAVAEHEHARAIVELATREAVAVAQAAGIPLPLDATLGAARQLGRAIAGALSSTAQDIERGKRTEIDALNGYIARRGTELGVPAPVNQTLHALVKLLEESASARG
jgi:2-dehydropantoate 2-reductase